MSAKDHGSPSRDISARRWRFGDYEFDELGRELRVRKPVDLESKPLEVLLQLFHAGEVVTKEELLESVWPGTVVVDGSLATAVSKLRKAMGDEDQPAILTVPRLVPPGSARLLQRRSGVGGRGTRIQAGETVPGREQWRLSAQWTFPGRAKSGWQKTQRPVNSAYSNSPPMRVG